MRYRITNTSKNPPKPIFLVEAGKLLQPGESCLAARVDEGTRKQESVGDIKIEEGRFQPAPPPPPPGIVEPPTSKPSKTFDASEPLPGAWKDGQRPTEPESKASVTPVSADDIEGGAPGDKPKMEVHDASEPLPGAWVDGKRPEAAPSDQADTGAAAGDADQGKGGKGGKGKRG